MGFINFYQSPEERRAKYAYARELGLSSVEAKRFRDCRWTKCQRRVGITEVKTRRELWQEK